MIVDLLVSNVKNTMKLFLKCNNTIYSDIISQVQLRFSVQILTFCGKFFTHP